MGSLREIWDSISERFKNPLLYSFFFSWCISNYKIPIVLSGDASYSEKIKFIEIYLAAESRGGNANLIAIPLACAAVYVFIVPIVSLASTASNAIYERWHGNIRAWQSRKSVLTKEQRDILEDKINSLVTELRSKAESASAQINEIQNAYNVQISLGMPIIIEAYRDHIIAKSCSWAENAILMPEGRTIKADAELIQLVRSKGVPKEWCDVFSHMGPSGKITSYELSERANCDQPEALHRLLSLCALRMVSVQWEGSSLTFPLIESSWVALLNGRGA